MTLFEKRFAEGQPIEPPADTVTQVNGLVLGGRLGGERRELVLREDLNLRDQHQAARIPALDRAVKDGLDEAGSTIARSTLHPACGVAPCGPREFPFSS